ncbi:MAG: mechanosensitive ion channel [Myxococcaceae bacterium]|nr:mechanosensitive ion channel [Myxococcaceae bacterium]
MISVDAIRSAMPHFLREGAPFGTERWQWLVVPALFALTVVAAVVLTKLATLIGRRISGRTKRPWDDHVAEALASPLRLLFVAAVTWAWVPVLELPTEAGSWVESALRATLGVAFFWGLFRVITLVASSMTQSQWVKARPGSGALVSLGARVARIALVAVGVVTVLSSLGYPVASLLAGLGIGGLALALAAQKTVENLFGAFAIAVDQPFREGDAVTVDGVTGTVESIGMRSTRLRTVERTLITMPNGKLADLRIENIAVRDRLRFSATVRLVYSTTAAQMKQVLEGLEAALRAQPKLWPDGVVVRFKELSVSSLDIEIGAWFATSDWSEFIAIRQEVLLGFLAAVEKAGTTFALPPMGNLPASPSSAAGVK